MAQRKIPRAALRLRARLPRHTLSQANPPDWRTEYFYEHPTLKDIHFIPASQALVRQDWKYFYWPDYELEQLFNLKADTSEENDLATNPKYASQLDTMRQRFNQLKAVAQ